MMHGAMRRDYRNEITFIKLRLRFVSQFLNAVPEIHWHRADDALGGAEIQTDSRNVTK